MARAKKSNKSEFYFKWYFNPKQVEFWNAYFHSPARFILYGGAKGGGKTHILRTLSVFLALTCPGISILIVRETFDEVRQNHIEPIKSMLPLELYSFNGQTNTMEILVGDDNYDNSTIKFGNWAGSDSENKYAGQEYDLIIIDEASHFYKRMFDSFKGCLRGTTFRKKLPKGFTRKILMATNPGGVGHIWLKRLFVDRRFDTTNKDVEKRENPDDYKYIKALAEDNIINIKQNPTYLSDIAQMPNYKAMRYGDWEILSGQYFDNFDPQHHIMKSFGIPEHWKLARAIDYGLDLFVCHFFAIDTDGRIWVYRSLGGENINAQPAAEMITSATLRNEKDRCSITWAGPDLWSRGSTDGKSVAEMFAMEKVPLYKASNDRVNGHLAIRAALDDAPLTDKYVKLQFSKHGVEPPETMPMLMFFDNVGQVIEDIQSIQHDEKNPSDCAKDPHEITHTIDALRYGVVELRMQSREPAKKEPVDTMLQEKMGRQSVKSQLTGKTFSSEYIRGYRHGI